MPPRLRGRVIGEPKAPPRSTNANSRASSTALERKVSLGMRLQRDGSGLRPPVWAGRDSETAAKLLCLGPAASATSLMVRVGNETERS